MARNIIGLLLGLIIGLTLSLITASYLASTYPAVEDNECVQVAWHRVMFCEWPFGHFTNYTAGNQNIVLAGNMPFDSRLNGYSLKLKGYLVENGSCTMLNVTDYKICYTPDITK